MNMSEENKKGMHHWLKIVLIVLLVIVLARLAFGHEGGKDESQNTISLSGHGEVTAVPDIANVYFNISKDAKTVKDAQALVAQVEKSSLDLLKTDNVLDKDIQTSNASFYPKYEYTQQVCPLNTSTYCPPNGKQVITGYTASESITVKVRNTDDVGKIMQGLGTVGVSDLSGPNFSIDNEDALKATARKNAIDDAKAKAQELAKELGVHLGRITSFSENANYPMPMYAAKGMMDSAAVSSAPAQLPKGENTITSDVTITYEIR
jgi:uncharacterized protein YggE